MTIRDLRLWSVDYARRGYSRSGDEDTLLECNVQIYPLLLPSRVDFSPVKNHDKGVGKKNLRISPDA